LQKPIAPDVIYDKMQVFIPKMIILIAFIN